MWYVYLLRCRDNSLYTGVTSNLENRLVCHNKGRASKYTRTRRPVELLYAEEFDDKSSALSREIEIKDFSVENKRKLIQFGIGQRFPSAQEKK